MKDLSQENKKSGPSLYLTFLRTLEKILTRKSLIKIGVFSIAICIIFFPTETGDLLGTWYHKLTEAFSKAGI
jgi:hypothetical protein